MSAKKYIVLMFPKHGHETRVIVPQDAKTGDDDKFTKKEAQRIATAGLQKDPWAWSHALVVEQVMVLNPP